MAYAQRSRSSMWFHCKKYVSYIWDHRRLLPIKYYLALPTLKTRLAQKPKENGAPTLLFIAGGALRVADITRVLKTKTMKGEKGGDIAKLFARHFKLEDHVAYLKRTKIGAAVGTPGRIGKLLCETGEHFAFLLDLYWLVYFFRRFIFECTNTYHFGCIVPGCKEAVHVRHPGNARRDF